VQHRQEPVRLRAQYRHRPNSDLLLMVAPRGWNTLGDD
jgi:hypothetical protein